MNFIYFYKNLILEISCRTHTFYTAALMQHSLSETMFFLPITEFQAVKQKQATAIFLETISPHLPLLQTKIKFQIN